MLSGSCELPVPRPLGPDPVHKPYRARSPTLQLPVHVLPGPPGQRVHLSRPPASVSPRSASHLTRDSGDVLRRVSERSLTPAPLGRSCNHKVSCYREGPGVDASYRPRGAWWGWRAPARLEGPRPFALTKLIWGFCSFLFSARLQPAGKVDAAPVSMLPSLSTEACDPSSTRNFSFLLTRGVSLQGQCPWAAVSCQALGVSWRQGRTNGAVTPKGRDHGLTRSCQETKDPRGEDVWMTSVYLKKNKNFCWQFWVREGSRGEIISLYFPGWVPRWALGKVTDQSRRGLVIVILSVCLAAGWPLGFNSFRRGAATAVSSYRGCWKQSTDRRTDLSCRPLGPVHVFLEVGPVPGLGVWLGLRLASTRWPLPG